MKMSHHDGSPEHLVARMRESQAANDRKHQVLDAKKEIAHIRRPVRTFINRLLRKKDVYEDIHVNVADEKEWGEVVTAVRNMNRMDSLSRNDAARTLLLEHILRYEKSVSPEYVKGDRETVIREFFSYSDASFSQSEKDVLGKESVVHPSADKYAYALELLLGRYGVSELTALAEDAVSVLEKKFIYAPITNYGHSRSWFFWDLAKQYYFALYPEETTPVYRKTTQPVLDYETIDTIVYRHIGWEAYEMYKRDPNVVNDTIARKGVSEHLIASFLQMLNKGPNTHNTLSSSDLAELGKMWHEITSHMSGINLSSNISNRMSFRK
jgi:hypothetical protein